jgi:hypothetical protein
MFTDAVGQGFLLYLLDELLANGQHSACVQRPSGYTVTMRVKTVVRNGRLELEPGVTFHQGTEPSLFTVDEEDDLDDEKRARLHASIERIAAHLRLHSSTEYAPGSAPSSFACAGDTVSSSTNCCVK